jgi:probable HAF family extracellular repeat protein
VHITIDVPGSISTAAEGINDAGEIVGAFIDASGEKAFLLSGGNFTVL